MLPSYLVLVAMLTAALLSRDLGRFTPGFPAFVWTVPMSSEEGGLDGTILVKWAGMVYRSNKSFIFEQTYFISRQDYPPGPMAFGPK